MLYKASLFLCSLFYKMSNKIVLPLCGQGEDHGNDKEGTQRKGRSRGRGKGRGRGQYHHNNRGNHMGTPPSNNMVISEQPTMAKQPPGPRMPDGTRGFSMGRGKPVAVNIA